MQAITLKTNVTNHLKKMMKNNIVLWKLYDLYFILHNQLTLRKHASRRAPAARIASEPRLDKVTSQVATTSQCLEPRYKQWCDSMRSPARMNRKQWEFVYILETLRQFGCIAAGKRGLGFGCGQEPIPALLAKLGCNIVATDLDFDRAYDQGWATTQQHAATLEALNPFGMCPSDIFKQRVSFRVVNMNDIPQSLRGFDFLWSSCALEHLGSLAHGLNFIRSAMDCLNPGGIAVHTTEFNLSSDEDTIDAPTLALYRKKDMLELEKDLQNLGHTVLPFNFCSGTLPIDDYVDLPPYHCSPSLKIQIQQFSVTSIGIIIKKMA